MSEEKKVKRGRPMVEVDGKLVAKKINWSKANLLWHDMTNRDIAEKLGCSTVAVFLKRKGMIKDGKHVECARKKFARAKCLKVA